MNDRRSVKNLHITVQGHIDPQLPWEIEYYAYCHEQASQAHTHICVVLLEPLSKRGAISDFAQHNGFQEHQVNISVHKNWQTMVGYHTGRGDKPPCPNFCYQTHLPFPEIKPKRTHKTLNDACLSCNPVECINHGWVSILSYKQLTQSLDLYRAHEAALNKPIPTHRQCFYLWGPPGTGKSSSVRRNFTSLYEKDYRTQWWDGYAGQSAILIDELDEDVNPTNLKLWTDPFPGKDPRGQVKGGFISLASISTVFVTSNKPLELIVRGDFNLLAALKRRFMKGSGLIYYDRLYI